MQRIFSCGDLNTIQSVIRQYNVSYIVVGSLERAYAAPKSLDRFEDMVANGQLEKAFVSGDDILYRVKSIPPRFCEVLRRRGQDSSAAI